MLRKIVIIAAAVALVISVGYDTLSLPKEEAPKAGYLAPSFSLTGLDGNTYSVGGEREKALLINFWASWCYPCELEAPDLVRFSKQYASDLDIYAVNAMNRDTKRGMQKFVEQFNFDFPVLIDEDGDVMDLYRVLAFPTNILVDRNGVIKEVVLGYHPPEEIEAKIKKLIK